MMCLNMKDPALAEQLISEIQFKKLPVTRDFSTGEERMAYQPHQRPKIKYKSQVIGRVAAVRPTGLVECQMEHPRAINFMMGRDKSRVSIGR